MNTPHQKKTRPALWTTLSGARLNVRPALERQRREAKRQDASRKKRIRALVLNRKSWKPLRQRSKAMSLRMKLYHSQREKFLRAHSVCEACDELCKAIDRGHLPTSGLDKFQIENARAFRASHRIGSCHPTTEVHHRVGRVGKLLLDEQHWSAVCAEAHRFIHDNHTIALAAGVIGEGPWNKAPL